MMRKFGGAAALVLFATTAITTAITTAASADDDGTRTYALQDFSAIEISGAFELDVRVGGDYSIVLSGSEAELDRAEVSVGKGVLTLGTKRRVSRDKKRGDHESPKATITMPALDRLTVSGVVDADIRGVDAGAFAIALSGVGDVTIEGRCKRLDARVSGVGELDAKSLECADAEIALSGMGEAAVYARESAKAEVSGMGEIEIYGSPKTIDKRGGYLGEITVH